MLDSMKLLGTACGLISGRLSELLSSFDKEAVVFYAASELWPWNHCVYHRVCRNFYATVLDYVDRVSKGEKREETTPSELALGIYQDVEDLRSDREVAYLGQVDPEERTSERVKLEALFEVNAAARALCIGSAPSPSRRGEQLDLAVSKVRAAYGAVSSHRIPPPVGNSVIWATVTVLELNRMRPTGSQTS
jgi:hypothetical protein